MNKLIAALIALVVLIAAIIVLAPNLVPVNSYKDKIETQASKSIGRDVSFGDDLSFKLFPRTAFSVSDLTIANGEGFEGDNFAAVERADIGVRLIPFLFGGNVAIDKFVLTRPVINLQRRADGEANWELKNEAENAPQGERAAPKNIELGDVRIIEGQAAYSDAVSGNAYSIEDINVAIKLDSMSEPLEIDGDLIFEGAPTTIDLVLTTPADLQANRGANIKLNAEIDQARLGADLALAAGDALSYEGPISVNAPDLAALAKVFGIALEDAPGFDKLSLSGQAKGAGDNIEISGATIQFDAIDAGGDIAFNWAGAKPKATGSLNVGALDLRPYLPPPAQNAQGFPAWSEAPMDFSSLRNVDADLNVRAERVMLNDLKFGESQMRIAVENGRMVADIPRLSMYGGGGSGRVVVNARRATPSFAGNFNTTSVQAEPFALDVLKNDRVLGVGSMRFDFTASGASQKAIMQSIDGKGGFDLNDGALKGVNIAKLAKAASDLYEGGSVNPAAIANAISTARQPAEQTDFSKFISEFVIENGLMRAPTISLEGPYLTMTGQGAVNLPNQTIDIRLSPRASTSADGKEGRSVAIPVKIGGTFGQPTMSIDAESLIRGRAESAIKDIIGGAFGSSDGENGDEEDNAAKSILRGVLGGSDESDTATDNTAEEGVVDAITSIFGSRRKDSKESENSEDSPE